MSNFVISNNARYIGQINELRALMAHLASVEVDRFTYNGLRKHLKDECEFRKAGYILLGQQSHGYANLSECEDSELLTDIVHGLNRFINGTFKFDVKRKAELKGVFQVYWTKLDNLCTATLSELNSKTNKLRFSLPVVSYFSDDRVSMHDKDNGLFSAPDMTYFYADLKRATEMKKNISWNGFPSGCAIWGNVKHVVIEARKKVCVSNDTSFEYLEMSEAIKKPEKVDCWSILGLMGDDWELLHDAETFQEALKAATEAFSHINENSDIQDIAKAVKQAFKWEGESVDWTEYDSVETRGVEFTIYHDGSSCFCDADEGLEDCYSVYGHYSDPDVGGCERLAIVWSEAEMTQLSKIVEALIN